MQFMSIIKLDINLTLNQDTAQEKISGLIIIENGCVHVIFSIHFLSALSIL
jgi:hypothetical protein